MRLFTLFLLFALSSLNAFSQSIPMLDTNVSWVQRQVSYADNIVEYFPYSIWSNGDTLINDTLYYKIYWGDEYQTTSSQESYIREDNGKIFFRMTEEIDYACFAYDDSPFNQDLLLFDTTADEGDTIEVWNYWNASPISRLLISNVDTLFIAGMDRRVLSFYSLDTFAYGDWIEGIGTDRGLFAPWCSEVQILIELGCYSVNDSLVYQYLSNCGLVGVEEYDLNNQISILPNPSDRYIAIQNERNSNALYAITIYDLKGREHIRQEGLNHDSKVDISEFPSGMYFVHIQFEDGGKAIKKFVKK